MRNQFHDCYRGVLIIFVILGHMLKGSLEDNFLRHVIYCFHMPLFASLSGYYFNIQKFNAANIYNTLKGYFHRLIVPLLVCVLIYSFLLSVKYNLSFLNVFLNNIKYPFYHLWYIPALISWIFITVLMHKSHLNSRIMIVLGFLISIFFDIYFNSLINIKSNSLDYITHTFRPFYFFYFIIGNFFYRYKAMFRINLITVLVLLLISITYSFYYKNYLSILLSYFSNTYLILFIDSFSNIGIFKSMKLLKWIGINSLPIYLYHTIPITIAALYFDNLNLIYYYFSSFFLLIIFLIFINRLSKNKYMRQLLGM